MKQPLTYDELLAGYYGRHRHHPHAHHLGGHLTRSVAKLLAGYYGRPMKHTDSWRPPIAAISFSMDDGETLQQPASGVEEYVTQASWLEGSDEEYVTQASLGKGSDEEYVIEGASTAEQGTPPRRHAAGEPVEPRDEYEVDIVDPLGSTAARNRFGGREERRATPTPISPASSPPATTSGASPTPAQPASAPASEHTMAPPDDKTAVNSDEEFLADMQAILGGQKVYDPVTKKTLDADQVASQRTAQGGQGQGSGSNGQAIFDKIAQSMQYANKYDLGTVELENRFADFDRISDLEDRNKSGKRSRAEVAGAGETPLAGAAALDSQDFLQDLDAIHRQRGAGSATGSDTGDDPFAFIPPSSSASGGGGSAVASAGTAGAAAPALSPMPAVQIPNIQVPSIQIPNIQLPIVQMPPQMASQSAATALPVPVSSELGARFVASAVQTSFGNAAGINSYFAKLGGGEFIDWFNRNLAGHDPWAQRAIGTGPGVKANFGAIWDNLLAIFGTDRINLLQFVSLMSIFINEVGGVLAPVAERVGRPGHPGLAYAFDRIPGFKASYNDGGSNWTAYKCFRTPDYIAAHGSKALGATLQNTNDTRWGGHEYPSGYPTEVDPAVSGFIMEADFYKFRGRGLIQSTWRGAYLSLIRYIQAYTGAQSEILSRAKAWAGMDPDKAATVSSNADWDALFMKTGMEIACVAIAQHSAGAGHYLNLSSDPGELNGKASGSIWRMGKSISGGDEYADLFRRRVVAVCNLLGN